MADHLKFSAGKHRVHFLEPATCRAEELGGFELREFVAYEVDFLWRALAREFYEAAAVGLIKFSVDEGAAEFAGGVELIDDLLAEEEAGGAVAAETADNRLGVTMDPHFGALDQRCCFAQQIFAWFFLASHGELRHDARLGEYAGRGLRKIERAIYVIGRATL